MLSKLRQNEYIKAITLMGEHKWRYTVLTLLSCMIGSASSYVFAFVNKKLFNAIEYGDITLLYNAVMLAVIFAVLELLVIPIFEYFYASTLPLVLNGIHSGMFSKIMRLPIGYFETHHSGDIMSRLTNDIEGLRQMYNENVQRIVSAVIYGGGSVVVMFVLDWRITVCVLALGIGSVVVTARYAGPLRKLGDKIQSLEGTATEIVSDIIAGIRVLKLFNLQERIMGKYRRENDRLADAGMARAKKNALLDTMNFLVSTSSLVAVLGLGAVLVSLNRIDIGTVMAMLVLQRGMSGIFGMIGYMLVYMQESMAGAGRIYELLDEGEEPMRYPVEGSAAVDQMIVFRGIRFHYPSGQQALVNVDLAAQRDQITALVGESGGGKSTTMKLIMGFHCPQEGEICVDGRALMDYTLQELREKIAYVAQESYLFKGTLFDNIQYGRLEATQAQVEEAARAANAHDFITKMPEGYETDVGEGGAKLSGGQRQRVAIARALLKNAPILLLDEATSSLDSESEALVQEALGRLMRGRTTIAIAHRLSTVEKADLICVVDRGAVVDRGSHAELLARGGLYARFHALQFR